MIDGNREVEGKFARERMRTMAWTFSWNSAFVIITASDLELCGHVAAEVLAQERALEVLRHQKSTSDFCSSVRQCPVLLITVNDGRIITLELLAFVTFPIIAIFSADNIFGRE